MVRNILLFVSTLAILGVAFVGYRLLVNDPTLDDDTRGGMDTLPLDSSATGDALRIAGRVDIPPGEGVEFTVYEEHTGRPTQRFKCDEWNPVGGTKDQIAVTQPQLTVWLPSGMTATIAAAEGNITVDHLQQAQSEPRRGWLAGGVQITLDRPEDDDGPRPAADTDERITVTVDRLDFDLELGELKTEDKLEIISSQFEIAGTGFDLVWNEAENTVESLWIQQGERLVLFGGEGLFRDTTAASTGETAQPAEPPARPRRGASAYACVLTGNIVAEQFIGEDLAGTFTADELRLLFDLGAAADRLASRDETAASQPAAASQPLPPEDANSRQRLVVHWSGPLRVGPAPAGDSQQRRRHLEAVGNPVTISSPKGNVECGRLEYYDETEQLWLHPAANGLVTLGRDDKTGATASSIYYDGKRNLVKLVGDVEIATASGDEHRAVRCDLWAELRLRARPEPLADTAPDAAMLEQSPVDLLGSDRLESALFVGDAEFDLGDRTLSAQRIDVSFRDVGDDRPFETSVEKAVATGSVRLMRETESLECAQLELMFETLAVGDSNEVILYPARVDATGSVIIARDSAWLHGQHVRTELLPAPGARPGQQRFVMRALEVIGNARLRDPENKVGVRGERISASFTGANQLSHATVYGLPGNFGLVQYQSYHVYGGQIDVELDAKQLYVNGPARLKFRANRGLTGRRSSRDAPIVITCADSLLVDGGTRNTVHFAGDVVARSGDEQLSADTLTLLMEDLEPPQPTSRPFSQTEVLRVARQALMQAITDRKLTGPADMGGEDIEVAGDWSRSVRKQPVRLRAENALVRRETSGAAGEPPLIHSSIGAPVFEVDFAQREIITQGETTLLLMNRDLEGAQQLQPQMLGIPSALITKGASQSAMRCAGSMVYALGAPGPTRRDSVLFKNDVLFRHRAGHDATASATTGLDVQSLDRPDSRDTWMECDRLECVFVSGGGAGPDEPAAVGGAGMQLMELLASGNTELRDQQGAVIRSVFARQIDFDRGQSLIRVLGTPQANARIYEENKQTTETRILVGEEFTIDLAHNTVRSGATRGEFTVSGSSEPKVLTPIEP